METYYAVYNTNLEQFIVPVAGIALMDKETAEALASELNQAMKPEYQNYNVVTVTFNSEI